MKHSVIEKMFRDQYALKDCDRVDVIHVAIDKVSEFIIEDYVTDGNGHTH